MPGAFRRVIEREIRRAPELERHAADFGKPSLAGAAHLVGRIQSSQDAEEVANGLERERRKLLVTHENGTPTRSSDVQALQRTASMKPRGPKSREPTHVGALLGGGRARAEPGHVDRERWRRIVGERVAARTRPGRLHEGTLTVYVASAVWAQELSLLSTAVLERLHAAGIEAEGLRFRVGDIDPLPDTTGRRPSPCAPSEPPEVALPKALAEQVARIADANLRAKVTEAASFSLGKRESVPATSKRPKTRGPLSDERGTDPTARDRTRRHGARKGTA